MTADYKFTENKSDTAAKQQKQLKAKKADSQRRLLDEDPAAYIKLHTITGHAYESHVAVSDQQILDNVLAQRKVGDTVYASPEMEQFCTSEILYANMERIQDFASSAMPGSKTAYFAEFTDPDTDEPMYVGRGFISGADDKRKIYSQGRPIKSIDTSIAAVVVRANPDAADGWEITTSFPASHPDIEPQSRHAILDRRENIENLMHQTDTYQSAGPVKQAYMDTAFTGKLPEGVVMGYQAYRGSTQPPRVQIAYENEPFRPVARVVHHPGTPDSRVKFMGNVNRVRPEVWNLANDMRDKIDENIASSPGKSQALPKANDAIRKAPETALPTPGRDAGPILDRLSENTSDGQNHQLE